MYQNGQILRDQLRTLSYGYPIAVADDLEYCIVGKFLLPPGYNARETEVLIYLPRDYPLSPPGIDNAQVFVRPRLRFHGCRLKDVHENCTPDWTDDFCWLCYRWIDWDPSHDNLVTFTEMLRADLSNAEIRIHRRRGYDD